MRRRILPISVLTVATSPSSAFSPPPPISGSIISHNFQSAATGFVTTKKRNINSLQHRHSHRRDLRIITTSFASDSNTNNSAIDDLWTASSDIDIIPDLNLSNNNDDDDNVEGSTHEIMAPTNGSNAQQILSSSDTTDNSLKNNDDSDPTTKYIFFGGTILILIVAGVLAVNMGNDLGIDLELGYVCLFLFLLLVMFM